MQIPGSPQAEWHPGTFILSLFPLHILGPGSETLN